jgi:hypothetical protein
MRDIDTIDSELRLVAALRRAAWERGGPLPSIDVADALLDERLPFSVSARRSGGRSRGFTDFWVGTTMACSKDGKDTPDDCTTRPHWARK